MEQLTYAKVGGPPDDWQGLKVVDLDTGQEVEGVVQVDAKEGWLRRYKMIRGEPVVDKTGHALVIERIRGRFEIRRPDNADIRQEP